MAAPNTKISGNASDFEIVLRADTNGLKFDWRELWSYRELLFIFIWRDFAAKYKQTILGPLWFIIQPLLVTVVFTVIFGRVAGLSQMVFELSSKYPGGTGSAQGPSTDLR